MSYCHMCNSYARMPSVFTRCSKIHYAFVGSSFKIANYYYVNVLINIIYPQYVGTDTSFVLLLSILMDIRTKFKFCLIATPNLQTSVY